MIQVPEGRPNPTGYTEAAEKTHLEWILEGTSSRACRACATSKTKAAHPLSLFGLSREELFDDMLARYSGHFVVGRDLDVY
jgi:hypothetical protein